VKPRFFATPESLRQKTSNWSSINIARVAELTKLGRMRPAGLAAFEARAAARTGIYAYENRHAAVLDAAREARFRENPRAWAFFQAQPEWYRKTTPASARAEALDHHDAVAAVEGGDHQPLAVR
jgi:uncharacterized protein YdeI (YjbR/CyaY-like superfamily)